jgi:hypothetical protein
MSVSDEGDPVGAMMFAESGNEFPARLLGEGGEAGPAMLRAMQPAGAVFALGWVMAELFDPRRRVSVTVPSPPFDADRQLPLAADLAADPKLVYLAAQLAEYLRWFPRLGRPLRLVTAQTNRKKRAVDAENLATAQGAEQADDVQQAAAATAAMAVRPPFSEVELLAAVSGLNQAILDEFADDPERLSAYQLGLALSDLVWLPSLPAAGQDFPAARPSALLSLFARSHLSRVQTLLSGAGAQLPAGAATTVSRSLDNWADWVDVNNARVKVPEADAWAPDAAVVLHALRAQGWVWRSVLIADPAVAVQPAMGAWVQAGSSIARAARMITESFLRRFWPLVVLALVVLGGLLYLVISNLSGVSQVWASLATVAAVLGGGGWGLSSGVSSAFSGVGYEIWSAAKLDAAAWNITWLPALNATAGERAAMDRRGVAMPQLRQSLDVTPPA